MKRFFLFVAICGYVICVGWFLLPALTPFRFTEACVGMSVCAIIAFACGSEGQRWVAMVALVVGLVGVVNSWQHNSRVHARIEKMVENHQERVQELQQTNTNR